MMKIYFPYKSDKKPYKYFIITSTGKKVFFGNSDYQDFTTHKDEERKQRYIKRHEKRENWNDKDTAGFWSRWYLWNKPTKQESYQNIKSKFL